MSIPLFIRQFVKFGETEMGNAWAEKKKLMMLDVRLVKKEFVFNSMLF